MVKSNAFIPVVPPQPIQEIFTDDENQRLFTVMRTRGPWRTIAGRYFKTAEELLAVSSRPAGDGETLSLSDFLTPAFRGFFGNNGMVYEDEVHDIFYSKKLIDLVKAMHGAKYGAPYLFQFNILGPSHGKDPGHFDGGSWRGVDPTNTSAWLLSVMAKSGLFDRWAVKAGQVISYYYRSDVDGGFTYWPDGPTALPQRISPPFWNNGLVADNQRMFHRGEACGPRDKRDPSPDLALSSTIEGDGEDSWVVKTDGKPIARYPDEDMRILFHYDAHVFEDMADVKRYFDHTHDLTRDRVFEMLIADLRARGVIFEMPSDPLNDPAFIAVLTKTYDVRPASYPAEAMPEWYAPAA